MGRPRPVLIATLCASCVLCPSAGAGCVFDPSGLSVGDATQSGDNGEDWMTALDRGQQGSDQAVSDSSDLTSVGDQTLDLVQTPDSSAVKPVSAAALGATFGAAQVQCVKTDGTTTSQQIPIVDSATVSFFDGAPIVAAAPQETQNWVGSKPSVSVLWDPNACDEEKPGDSNWDTAGLLVRGAVLDAQKQLVLAPGSTTKEINLINVEGDGSWQGEFALPDDSELPTNYPQLVNPVDKAKQLIIQLGNP